jgi:cytochrome c-type biogenesis protein CcmH
MNGGRCFAKAVVLGWLLVGAAAACAAPLFAAEASSLDDQVQQIAAQLRCMVCNGQSVADSNASWAQDVRYFVQTKLQQGWSVPQIKAYLQERYGPQILFETPGNSPAAWILWSLPAGCLVMVGWRLRRYIG